MLILLYSLLAVEKALIGAVEYRLKTGKWTPLAGPFIMGIYSAVQKIFTPSQHETRDTLSGISFSL